MNVMIEIKGIKNELVRGGNAYMGSIWNGLTDGSEHLFQHSAFSSTSELP
jgi:hypothetical protein